MAFSSRFSFWEQKEQVEEDPVAILKADHAAAAHPKVCFLLCVCYSDPHNPTLDLLCQTCPCVVECCVLAHPISLTAPKPQK